MISRECVRAVVRREIPDRAPMDLWGTDSRMATDYYKKWRSISASKPWESASARAPLRNMRTTAFPTSSALTSATSATSGTIFEQCQYLRGTENFFIDLYMESTNQGVKSVAPDTLVLQAAGIRSGEDVYNAICSGAEGTGATSGIVAKPDPCGALQEMIEALDRARQKRR